MSDATSGSKKLGRIRLPCHPRISAKRGRQLALKRGRLISPEAAEVADLGSIVASSLRNSNSKQLKDQPATFSRRQDIHQFDDNTVSVEANIPELSSIIRFEPISHTDIPKCLQDFGIEEQVNAVVEVFESETRRAKPWPDVKDHPRRSSACCGEVSLMAPSIAPTLYRGLGYNKSVRIANDDVHLISSAAIKQYRPRMRRGCLLWSEDFNVLSSVASKEPLRPTPKPLRDSIRQKLYLADVDMVGEFNPCQIPAPSTTTMSTDVDTDAPCRPKGSNAERSPSCQRNASLSQSPVEATIRRILLPKQLLPHDPSGSGGIDTFMATVAAATTTSEPPTTSTGAISSMPATITASSSSPGRKASSFTNRDDDAPPSVHAGNNISVGCSNKYKGATVYPAATTLSVEPSVAAALRETYRPHAQALECALGRHMEGIADAAIQMVFDELIPTKTSAAAPLEKSKRARGTDPGSMQLQEEEPTITRTGRGVAGVKGGGAAKLVSSKCTGDEPSYMDYFTDSWKPLDHDGGRGSKRRAAGVRRNTRAEKRRRVAATAIAVVPYVMLEASQLLDQQQPQQQTQTQHQQREQQHQRQLSQGQRHERGRQRTLSTQNKEQSPSQSIQLKGCVLTWEDVLAAIEKKATDSTTAMEGASAEKILLHIHPDLPDLNISRAVIGRVRGRLLGLFGQSNATLPASLRRDAPEIVNMEKL